MVLQQTKNRVQKMLSHTVLKACRKCLPYEDQLSVKGILEIILDKNEIILFQIKDTILKSKCDDLTTAVLDDECIPKGAEMIVTEKFTRKSPKKTLIVTKKKRGSQRTVKTTISLKEDDKYGMDESTDENENENENDAAKSFPNLYSQCTGKQEALSYEKIKKEVANDTTEVQEHGVSEEVKVKVELQHLEMESDEPDSTVHMEVR